MLCGLLVVAATLTGVVRVWRVVGSAERTAPVLFDHGLSAIAPEQIHVRWTNESCEKCHAAEYTQWKRSRHHVAATNEGFRAQLLTPGDGRKQWCVNCHAPINPGATNLPTQEPAGLDALYASPPSWLVNGVDCLACHVRGDEILVTKASAEAARAHPIRVAPELGTAEFCGGCHQFNSHSNVFPDSLSGQLQQASFEEFLDHSTEARCHDCHMIGGDHHMPGGFDKSMIRNALSLDLSAEWNADQQSALVSADVTVGHVGHRVPGGEHFFRHLTLRTVVERDDGAALSTGGALPRDSVQAAESELMVRQWPRVETFGHKMGTYEKYGFGEPNPDTRLSPGQSRSFRYRVPFDPAEIGSVVRVRSELWYHVLEEENARLFGLSVADTRWIVVSQETRLALGGNE